MDFVAYLPEWWPSLCNVRSHVYEVCISGFPFSASISNTHWKLEAYFCCGRGALCYTTESRTTWIHLKSSGGRPCSKRSGSIPTSSQGQTSTVCSAVDRSDLRQSKLASRIHDGETSHQCTVNEHHSAFCQWGDPPHVLTCKILGMPPETFMAMVPTSNDVDSV